MAEEKLETSLDDAVAGLPAVGAKVFVGNLAYSTSWQVLKDHMRKAGPVVRADVMTNADGRSKGFGLVEFVDSDTAREAISQLNGTTLDGREIVVREDRDPASRRAHAVASAVVAPSFEGFGEGAVRLFIGNLNWRVESRHLMEAFTEAGDVTEANVITGYDGRSKGFGIVEMATMKDAERAIEMFNGKDMDGRVVTVRFDRRSKPKSRRRVFVDAAEGASAPTPSDAPVTVTAKTNRVYVGNLSWNVTWGELKDTFRQWGDVSFAKVATGDDGRSRGWGIVEFTSTDEASRAIEHGNGTYLDGRRMYVREDERSFER